MKYYISTFLVAISLLSAMAFQDQPIKYNPEKKTFLFQSEKRIQIAEEDNGYLPVSLEKGKNWVFKYYFAAKESEMVADDEYTEYFMMELPPQKGKSFKVTGDLSKYNMVFSKSCFCRDSGPRRVTAGTMKGRKTNKGWEIELVLSIPSRDGKGSPEQKTIKGLFIPGSLDEN